MIQKISTLNSKNKLILIALAFILNLVLRLPSVPHEIGNDSYQIHVLANSITQFGFAKWWINIYSVFGLYTFSYASSVPFLLSGIQQLGNFEMESVVWVMGTSLGLFSMFSAYLMATSLSDKFFFRFAFSLFYSISQGILQFTVWDASTRGLFLVMFPLFFYFLAKENMSLPKKIVLICLLFLFLRATHNFAYFGVIVFVSYVFTQLLLSIGYVASKIKQHSVLANSLYLASLIFLITFAFLTKFMMVGSRYGSFLVLIVATARYVGPILIFAIGGAAYAIFKDSKSSNEWFMLVTVLMFSLIFFSADYGKFILLPLTIYFVAIGFKNMLFSGSKSKIIHIFIILIILSSSIFSGFYNHYRTGDSQGYWYMKEQTNVAGLWARDSMELSSHILTTGGDVWRLIAISNGHAIFPSIPPVALTYDFISEDEAINSTIASDIFSLSYFFDGPYVQKSGTYFWGKYDWISNFPVDDNRYKTFIELYDIKYLVFDTYSYRSIMSNIDSKKSKVYDNRRIVIYIAEA
ncbi:hypothetical protein RE474_01540 [Methanolobus sediminis]|uniref:Uncharacterized protein n=1 Tax=Methanolobus sediminis TaxID=3072978 RepID=A0AA51UKV2_9EURY|nr:hypothetical protein [Methanolobus sediminis]WMW25431.1 hypothetical protein RE474_01540 [Methanolobus sediminis]